MGKASSYLLYVVLSTVLTTIMTTISYCIRKSKKAGNVLISTDIAITLCAVQWE